MLNELQRKKFTLYFNLWDQDHNGQLAFEDYLLLSNRIAQLRGLAQGSEQYREMYDATVKLWENIQAYADPDQDGRVSLPDWLAYCETSVNLLRKDQLALQAVVEQAVGLFFNALDLNGDGWLTPVEWGNFVKAWGIGQGTLTSFVLLDLDGDGRLSLADILSLYRQFLLSDDPREPGNYLFGPLDSVFDPLVKV